MLLKDKNAIVYGAGGAIGGALARAFAREGATVFLAGRTLAPLETLAKEITEAGGSASAAQVDALNKAAVDAHAEAVAAAAGRIDISVNAIGIDHVQATPLVELDPEDFALPIMTYTRSLLLTSTAAGRQMIRQGGGVVLTLSTSAARYPRIPTSGFGTACAAVEAYSTQLAAELGPHGIRVVCLRPHGIPESAALGSHFGNVSARFAARAGVSVAELFAEPGDALLGRHLTLAEVAEVAVFLAADRASAVTATVVNVTGGVIIG